MKYEDWDNMSPQRKFQAARWEANAETIEAEEVHTEDKDTAKTKIVHNTIVNQYGEKNIHIDRVETLNL